MKDRINKGNNQKSKAQGWGACHTPDPNPQNQCHHRNWHVKNIAIAFNTCTWICLFKLQRGLKGEPTQTDKPKSVKLATAGSSLLSRNAVLYRWYITWCFGAMCKYTPLRWAGQARLATKDLQMASTLHTALPCQPHEDKHLRGLKQLELCEKLPSPPPTRRVLIEWSSGTTFRTNAAIHQSRHELAGKAPEGGCYCLLLQMKL